MSRRAFTQTSALALAGLGLPLPAQASSPPAVEPLFKISLAQWSLHRTLFEGRLSPLNFAPTARREFDIRAVEYVNQFFASEANNTSYLQTMRRRAEEAGVRSLLIMCDGEGALGAPTPTEREQAVTNHLKWVEAADRLGCHSIRVNAQSEGSYDDQMKRTADGLRQLTEFATQEDLNVLVENHGGLSSNGKWLAGVMELVDHPNCGTLPDFGNFTIREGETYDPYQGIQELMPYAKGVSAKSYAFDADGNETNIDYEHMMRIVLEAGYRGHVGIEYEGDELSEYEGIRATKQLLERIRARLHDEYE